MLEHNGFEPTADVLEIGCGIGRLAYELAGVIDGGTYTGFDISKKCVRWLRRHYGAHVPGFAFDFLDVRNAAYRSRQGRSAATIEFPYRDASFDMVCSFAVFMHMQLDEISNYLGQTARVLRPGGRAVITMMAITEAERTAPPPHEGRAFHQLGDDVWTTQPDRPTAGLAFAQALLEQTIAAAGLDVLAFVPGSWRGTHLTSGPQLGGDTFIMQRPPRQASPPTATTSA